MKRGQTSTEYVILVAVVLVIGLAVASQVSDFNGVGSGLNDKVNSAKLLSDDIVVEKYSFADTSAAVVLRNGLTEKMQVSSLVINGTDCGITSTYLGIGDKSQFTCLINTTGNYDYPFVINYTLDGAVYSVEGTFTGRVSSAIFAIASSSSWTPANITTALWLDASDASTITESGGNVSRWDDKSGNGNDGVQENGLKQPTYSLNSINLDPSYSLELTTPLPSTWWSAINGEMVDAVGFGSLWYTKASHHPLLTNVGSTNLGSFYNSFRASSKSLVVGTQAIIEFAANVGDNTIVLNGDVTSESVCLGSTGVDNAATSIGDTLTPNQGFGKVREIIVLTSIPDTDTRQKIEGYLAWKWDYINGNTSLVDSFPAEHPYKLDGSLFGYS